MFAVARIIGMCRCYRAIEPRGSERSCISWGGARLPECRPHTCGQCAMDGVQSGGSRRRANACLVVVPASTVCSILLGAGWFGGWLPPAGHLICRRAKNLMFFFAWIRVMMKSMLVGGVRFCTACTRSTTKSDVTALRRLISMALFVDSCLTV